MRFLYNFIFCLSALLLLSCSKDELQNIQGHETDPEEITVSDGHLSFSSYQALENYFSDIVQGKVHPYTKSTGTTSFPGFISIADRKASIAYTKAGDSDEMTQEEYDLMMVENLLEDPALCSILDTNLEIEVEGVLFKITELGTFFIDKNDEEKLQGIIDSFDKTLCETLSNGESINIGGSAFFTNTFGKGSVTTDFLSLTDETVDSYDYQADYNYQDSPSTKAPTIDDGVFKNDFHVGYGTESYVWKNSSLIQKFADLIRGKDVKREVNFDSSHRVKVSVVDVNYAFYATTAIKCEMQKQKKLLGIKYWVDDTADNIAIGFNKLYGELKMNNPISYSSIAPSTSKYWGKFSGKIDDITSNFIFGITGLDIIKDWTNDLTAFIPEFKLFGKTYSNVDIGNKLYEASKDKVYKWLKSQAGKCSLDLVSGVQKKIEPKDPRVAYFVWGNTTLTYNKEKPFIIGVKEYGKSKKEVVRFDQSFGISFNLLNGKASAKGFLPTVFNIKDIDAFGAAKYNGVWKGVRFTMD